MKKCRVITWAVLIGVFPQALVAVYADQCTPVGTVLSSDCPRNTVIYSFCGTCNPSDYSSEKCYLHKDEDYRLAWDDHTVDVEVVTHGQVGVHWTCNVPAQSALDPCWPAFLDPVVTSTTWSQTYVDRGAYCPLLCSSHPLGPYQTSESCDDAASQTKTSSGTCYIAGGGGRGARSLCRRYLLLSDWGRNW